MKLILWLAHFTDEEIVVEQDDVIYQPSQK